jgi:hypothetical protein
MISINQKRKIHNQTKFYSNIFLNFIEINGIGVSVYLIMQIYK